MDWTIIEGQNHPPQAKCRRQIPHILHTINRKISTPVMAGLDVLQRDGILLSLFLEQSSPYFFILSHYAQTYTR